MEKILTHNRTFADITMLNEAIKDNPNNAVLYYERGWINQQLKDESACLSDWEMALKLNPGFLEVYSSRALFYFLKGEIQHSENDIIKAKEINPELSPELKHLTKLLAKQRENPHNYLTADSNSRRDFL